MIGLSKRTKNRLSACHFTQFWYDSSGPSQNRPLWQHNKKGTMAGHSILYLGRGEFGADYLSELETLPYCALLTRSAKLEVPADAPSIIDVILLEAGPAGIGASVSYLEALEQAGDPKRIDALVKHHGDRLRADPEAWATVTNTFRARGFLAGHEGRQ